MPTTTEPIESTETFAESLANFRRTMDRLEYLVERSMYGERGNETVNDDQHCLELQDACGVNEIGGEE